MYDLMVKGIKKQEEVSLPVVLFDLAVSYPLCIRALMYALHITCHTCVLSVFSAGAAWTHWHTCWYIFTYFSMWLFLYGSHLFSCIRDCICDFMSTFYFQRSTFVWYFDVKWVKILKYTTWQTLICNGTCAHAHAASTCMLQLQVLPETAHFFHWKNSCVQV